MIQIARWKRITIIALCVLGVLYAMPNLFPKSWKNTIEQNFPSFVPHKTVNLGLDLQGGSHLLLQVELGSVIKERSEALVNSLRPELRSENIGYKRLNDTENGVVVQVREQADVDKIKKIIRKLDNALDIDVKDDNITASFSDTVIKGIQNQAISQSIEIVRRRIDETGTNEPIIQRQGDDRILVQLPGVDDPERIKKLLGTTAKLTFHLVDVSDGKVGGVMVLPVANEPGQTLAVNRRTELTGDMLVSASYATDQSGQPAVGFQFDAIGAKKFCTLSRDNRGRLFAIVLDNQIISAPVIDEPICGGQGIIRGGFTIKEVNDLALLLRAGALPAPLTILEERSVGPSLGADSVQAGKTASIIGFLSVVAFMILTYRRFGVYASIALSINVAMIFSLLSAIHATLTLPGIAGIVLTIGMAVDANVLIYERIKEEMNNGRSVMSAVDSGFTRAIATIVDSNLTTLIATTILFFLGTGPIKGFAVTLTIGILTSMFTAVLVTRLMVVHWLNKTRPTQLNI